METLVKIKKNTCLELIFIDRTSYWGCQAGWYDHDHCQKYYPVNSVSGYKAGWNHGSCK